MSAQPCAARKTAGATIRDAATMAAVQSVCRCRHGGISFPWCVVVFVEHCLLGNQLAIGGRFARDSDVRSGMANFRS